MIYIEERKGKRISGITSLFLSFYYNPEVINIIKQSGAKDYNKLTKEWEVPLTSLAFLLDNLTLLDDISLKLKAEEERTYTNKPMLTYRTTPFEHQLEAITHGLNNDSWLLLDAPGLGKSLSAIYLAEELAEQRGIQHCLVVCGLASLRANWEKEIKLHSTKSAIVLGKEKTRTGKVKWATIAERTQQLKSKIDEFFIIVNIETLRDEKVIQAIKKGPNKIDMIILDEAHKIKGATTAQSKRLLALNGVKYKVALTGTLITNSPLDTYVPLKWINAYGGTLTDYKAQYCDFGGHGGREIIGFKNMETLKGVVEHHSLRRTKDLLDLPSKNITNETVELTPEHLKVYESVVKGIKEDFDKIELKTSSALSLTVRLRQAASCPAVLTSTPVVNNKIERAVDLVEELIQLGEKVVIMSTFKAPVYELAKRLEKYKPLIGTGDVSEEQFTTNRTLFQEDDEHMVFIGTTDKSGTGIDLYRAKYMICIDTPWTYALQLQVEDRIHRIGTTHPVFIYRLIGDSTIDEKVITTIDRKKALSEYVVDDIVDDGAYAILKEYINEL